MKSRTRRVPTINLYGAANAFTIWFHSRFWFRHKWNRIPHRIEMVFCICDAKPPDDFFYGLGLMYFLISPIVAQEMFWHEVPCQICKERFIQICMQKYVFIFDSGHWYYMQIVTHLPNGPLLERMWTYPSKHQSFGKLLVNPVSSADDL